MTSLPALLTTSEVAEALRVDSATVRRWIAAGTLPAVRLPSGQSRITREVLDDLLRRGAVERSA